MQRHAPRISRRPRSLVAAIGILGVATLSAAACSSPGIVGTSGFDGGKLILGTPGFVTLRSTSSCDDLLARLRDEAASRVTAYGFGAGGINYATDSAAGRVPRSAPATTATASNAAGAPTASKDAGAEAGTDAASRTDGGEFSTTNRQEAGVDEPDLVKTDGTIAYVVGGGALRVVRLGSAPPVLLGTASLDDIYPTELLLSGSRVLVFGHSNVFVTEDAKPSSGASSAVAPDIGPAPQNRATITEIDAADPSHPVVGRTLALDGEIVTSRLVDHTARVVVRASPENLSFVYPQSPSGGARAAATNRQVVNESVLSDWLPAYSLRSATGDEVSSGLVAPCNRVEVPTEFAGFGTVSVLTFDTLKPLDDGSAVSVMAGVENVYASERNLFVATTRYDDAAGTPGSGARPAVKIAPPATTYGTSIHQFDITGTAPAQYVASGGVDGHLLDQFAMSEHDGVLRVASTKGSPWGNGTESIVSVLKRDDSALVQIGQVGGMGRGERLYSVRFSGTMGYAVTFRQTDPFYTLDLSDPTNPRVVGELKIPGYSSYLHPIDGDRVIGVGQDGRSAKVSVFDVHDPAAPTEVAKWTLPASQTGAQWDHHAFLYWPGTGTDTAGGAGQIVLPVQQWGLGRCAQGAACPSGFVGAVVLRLQGTTLTEQGRITHPQRPGPSRACPANAICTPDPKPTIERSFVAAGGLWTVADDYLQANDLATLAVRGGVGW
jgi:hypothetical protein